MEFRCFCHSCGGSGSGPGLSGRSTLCLLQTGRADIQKQGMHVFYMLLSFIALSLFKCCICYIKFCSTSTFLNRSTFPGDVMIDSGTDFDSIKVTIFGIWDIRLLHINSPVSHVCPAQIH